MDEGEFHVGKTTLRPRGRGGNNFFARLGGVMPEDGDPAPEQPGLVDGKEADFAGGQDSLLIEFSVSAALLDESVLHRAPGTNRDAHLRRAQIGIGNG